MQRQGAARATTSQLNIRFGGDGLIHSPNKPAMRGFSQYQIGELATREERRMLVRTMVQEAGCDVGTMRIVWVKVNPDYEILFRLMDRLRPDARRRYWIREQGAEGNIVDIEEETEQAVTQVKIAFPVSHNALTIVEEYEQ